MIITPDTLFTSDTHFGHHKLVDWKTRPEEFNEIIVKNWNKTVNKKDVVVVLGDLTMVGFEETLFYTSKLNGKKYLVRGNHDEKSTSWYKRLGFEVLPDLSYKYHDKYDNWYRILFTHEPVHPIPEKWLNVHGHLHGNGHRASLKSPNHIDVGVDCFNFSPVKLSVILSRWWNQTCLN